MGTSESSVFQAKSRVLKRLRGKCQYIPNSFVPVHPEQQQGYNTP
jgi:hypothetical protein